MRGSRVFNARGRVGGNVRIFRLYLYCLIATFVPSQVWGQAATASITGTITDTTGAAIPGAAVTVKNTGTSATVGSVTDAQGRYSVPDLPIGVYEVATPH